MHTNTITLAVALFIALLPGTNAKCILGSAGAEGDNCLNYPAGSLTCGDHRVVRYISLCDVAIAC